MSLLATRPRARQLALAGERRHGEPPERDRRRREHQRCSDGGRPTLEQQLERVWEDLRAAGVAVCPLCGGRMAEAAEGGRCESCGSTIS